MKKIYVMGAILLVIGICVFTHQKVTKTTAFAASSSRTKTNVFEEKTEEYRFPEFYRGFYLPASQAMDFERLKVWVERAKRANMNSIVIDVQNLRQQRVNIPKENIQYLLDNGMHPIARIVIFPDGLREYPPPRGLLQDRYDAAIAACEIGFKEIQFDYIRFNDSNVVRNLSLEQRYAFIEGILRTLREKVSPYNVRTAADIFGRIPFNRGDLIGQRMETLDLVVDVICPMAYPSHYTCDRALQHDPYRTVYLTSRKAVERVQHAKIVTWIQAFQMRLGPNKFPDYIRHQMQAVYDSGANGYLFWNARSQYDIPFQVAEEFYRNK
jgi:hypothetical protein